MALNKYMHPRNIYRNPPNFSNLAKDFPEFANIVKIDVTGKVTVDFKDPVALRILTKCLLKKDFMLEVEIPSDRLVPTLPLRLNYILWVEDLVNLLDKSDGVVGLDIGTGACAVYPLLAAVHSKWHMLGTESDVESLAKAQNNVNVNNLQDLVTLIHNPTKTIVEHILTSDVHKVFDFCMCNPPFYSNVQELCESRSPARPPPKNAFTGSPQELITEGGELEFIRTLISESKAFKDRILFYTTMVGHKYNLKVLLEDLKCEGIRHTHTEFCQGRVTRWGLAWTYQHHDFSQIEPSRDKPRKKTPPIACLLPPIPNETYDVQTVVNKLKIILNSLNIVHKFVSKRGTCFIFDVVAKENTWSNQRRKRRQQKRLEIGEVKKCKLDDNDNAQQVKELEVDTRVLDDCKHSVAAPGPNGHNGDVESISNEGKSVAAPGPNGHNRDVESKSNEGKSVAVSGPNGNNGDVESISNEGKSVAAPGPNGHNGNVESKSNEGKSVAAPGPNGHNGDVESISNEGKSVAAPGPNGHNGDVESISNEGKSVAAPGPNGHNGDVESISNEGKSVAAPGPNGHNGDVESKSNEGTSNQRTTSDNTGKVVLVHAYLKVFKKFKDIIFEMEFLDGSGRKEALHQIVQYIKNNWK